MVTTSSVLPIMEKGMAACKKRDIRTTQLETLLFKGPVRKKARLCAGVYHDVHVALGAGLIVTLKRESVALNVLGSNDLQDL